MFTKIYRISLRNSLRAYKRLKSMNERFEKIYADVI